MPIPLATARLLAATLATAPLPLLAQAAPVAGTHAPGLARRVEPGAFVRVHLARGDHPPSQGRVLALDSAAITLRLSPAWSQSTRTIPLERVRRVELRVREPDTIRGIRNGAIAGGVLALAAGSVWAYQYRRYAFSYAIATSMVVTIGVPLGVGAGAVVGWTAAPGARWQEVALTR